MYFPNVEWDAVKIEGIFEGDISHWNCDTEDNCKPRYTQQIFIPEFLFAEIETQVIAQMGTTLQIPPEDSDNKINIHR